MDKFSLKLDVKRKYFAFRMIINFLLLFALVLIMGINFFSSTQVFKLIASNRMVVHTYQVNQTVNSILLNLMKIESNTQGYVISGNKIFIDKIDEKIASMLQDAEKAKQLTFDNPAQQKYFSELQPILNKRVNLIYTLINSKNNTSVISEGYQITQEISTLLGKISSEEEGLLQKRNVVAINESAALNSVLFFANILSILLFALGIIILNISFYLQSSAFEEKLKLENLLKGIIEGTKDIIVALDKNFKFIIYNHSFEYEFKRIFGKRPLDESTMIELLSHLPLEQQKIIALWKRALSGEEFQIIEEFGDQTKRNIYEWTFSSIYDDKGKLIGAAAITRNIEHLIEAEKSLKLTHDKLEKAYQALKKHNLEISLFNEMENNLQSCSTTEETLNIINIYGKKLLPYTSGSIYLTNASRNYLEMLGEWGETENNEKIFTPDQCWGLRQGKTYFFINHELSIACSHQHDEIKPYLCVPMLAQNEMIGMLHLTLIEVDASNVKQVKRLVKRNELLINNLATQLAMSLTNIKLRENLRDRSIRDPLTGLYNRAYLKESLERDLQRAKRNHLPIAIVIMDVDHFKRFNDLHGHDAGDLVLKQMGNILQTNIRAADTVCRYGGEEFLIVLIESNIKDSSSRIEKLRQIISQQEINFRGTILENISASFGIANYPLDGEEMDILITQADKALFHSKRNGRNQVTVYSEVFTKNTPV